MRARSVALLVVIGVTASGCGSGAARLRVSPAASPAVAELLERQPAATSRAENTNSAALIALGEPGLATVCDLLGSSRDDDDLAAQYALGGLRRWVTRAGASDERMLFARVLTDALGRHDGEPSRAFLLELLASVGSETEIEAIAPLLRVPGLSDPAARALTAIGGAEATAMVVGALYALPSNADLLLAAGRLGAEAAMPLVIAAQADEDPRVREAAAAAQALLTGAPGEADPATEEAAMSEIPEEGFESIFNGVDLTGWVGATDAYAAIDGVLVATGTASGNLYTERQYADFELRFELRLTPGANNGLGIRAPLEGDAAYVGIELQILDNSAWRYRDLQPWQYHGSAYGIAPATRGALRPVGEWNAQEVTADGRRITVVLNGTTILDVDLDEVTAGGAIDGRDHPGQARERGHIGFLGHGSRVEFRNLRIRELGRNP